MSPDEQIAMLRAAMYELLDSTTRVTSRRACVAHMAASAAWIATTPAAERAAAIAAAQMLDPTIVDFDAAIKRYGTSLLQAVTP